MEWDGIQFEFVVQFQQYIPKDVNVLIESHYVNFMEEFANILHRQAANSVEAK